MKFTFQNLEKDTLIGIFDNTIVYWISFAAGSTIILYLGLSFYSRGQILFILPIIAIYLFAMGYLRGYRIAKQRQNKWFEDVLSKIETSLDGVEYQIDGYKRSVGVTIQVGPAAASAVGLPATVIAQMLSPFSIESQEEFGLPTITGEQNITLEPLTSTATGVVSGGSAEETQPITLQIDDITVQPMIDTVELEVNHLRKTIDIVRSEIQSKRGAKPTPLEEKVRIVRAWYSVQTSIKQDVFCSEHGISSATLRNWMREEQVQKALLKKS